ncbi:response regulator [Nitrosospira briensis]|uniref:response regulator n=1 Tax=Nitrosospira briensis TaxID=35799 RepID=UPI00046AF335|nr:response regulator [Nitrosospira briensis]
MIKKALIVEDSALKATNISSFLAKDFPFLPPATISGSFQSAIRAISETKPDLIILDMTLPTFDRKPNSREGRLRPLGGYDLMCKMNHKSLSAQIVVVTQLETFGEGDEEISLSEITCRCERNFPNLFVGSVYYDQSGMNWQTELRRLVRIALSKSEHL